MTNEAAPAPEPHPELDGLLARQAQLKAKAKDVTLSAESQARTALYLQQVAARIAEISKA